MNKEAILEGLLYVQGDEGIRLGEVCNILQIDEDEAKDLVIFFDVILNGIFF